MTDTIKISHDELQRIAQGCSCEVTTDALDALLATPPADAADMGGQAGEEVEVVAYIGRESRMTTEGWEDGHEYVVLAEHASDADKRYDVPLMTVAQHERIVAAFSAQQSAHVSVPRELLERTICRLTHGHEHDKAVRELRALLNGGEA